MKELQSHIGIKKEISKPITKENKLLNTLYPQQGHKCFEINLLTNECNEATFLESVVNITSISGEHYVNKKILVKENCVYITALNQKNAIKKYEKI
jgi:hypothetical protein